MTSTFVPFRRIVALFVAITLFAGPVVSAQSPVATLNSAAPVSQKRPAAESPAAATFDQLAEVTRPGAEVVVTDASGNAVIGKVQSITGDSVSLKIRNGWGSKTYEMQRDDIQTVRMKPDSSMTGAIAGALAGVGGMLMGFAFLSDDDNHSWLLALVPVGGVAGYFADRASRDQRLLYAKATNSRVSFGRTLVGSLSVRADVGLTAPANRRPAPRVSANIVIALDGIHRKRP